MNVEERIRKELPEWDEAKRLHPLEQLFWECTLRCNLNCRHCGSDCRAVSSAEDMPLEDFVPVLDELAGKMDASDIMVVTTGGEPLMRKDVARSVIVTLVAGRTSFAGVCMADPAAWIAALVPLLPYYFYIMKKWKTTNL